MKMLLDAILFAKRKHKNQKRKKSGDPYVTHPLAVSYIVAAYKRSKHLTELLVAALLHDCLEDTPTKFEEISRKFSPFVASLVLELSNDKDAIQKLGKFEYQARKMCGMSNYGLVLKLADRMHNISDSPTDQMVLDTLAILKRVRAARKLTKTQQAMIVEIERLCREHQGALAS